MRFRRLRFLDMDRVEFIPWVVVAACRLHNICLLSEETVEEFIEEAPDEVNHYAVLRFPGRRAADKRRCIMILLP